MKPTAQQILRERVQAELDQSGLGKAKFALMVGISRPQLDHILAGSTNTKLATADKIARGLGVETWELLKPRQDEPPSQAKKVSAA